jgi:hypothetical protein
MTATIKITLASGKTIELTKEELDEIVRNFGQQSVPYQPVPPWIPLEDEYPCYPRQWDVWYGTGSQPFKFRGTASTGFVEPVK